MISRTMFDGTISSTSMGSPSVVWHSSVISSSAPAVSISRQITWARSPSPLRNILASSPNTSSAWGKK